MTNVGSMPVSALAADVVARVAPDANLWQLAEALVEADVGALAVGDGDDALGVVSERDVVRALAGRRDPSATRTIEIAHTHVVWCDASSTVAEVAEEMMERDVRHVLLRRRDESWGSCGPAICSALTPQRTRPRTPNADHMERYHGS